MNKDLEKFLFAVPTGDGDFLDIAAQNNLSVYATHVGYISSLASSGKNHHRRRILPNQKID